VRSTRWAGPGAEPGPAPAHDFVPAGTGRGASSVLGAQDDVNAQDEVDAHGPPGDPDEVARIICLRMLDRRAYSRAELRTVLVRRGVPGDASDRVLDRFAALGLIDDATLAEGYAQAQHRGRGLSARAVAIKLRHRGIPDETVAAAVAQIDRESEAAVAHALVTRRLRAMSGLDPAVQARRLIGMLARKGYPPSVASEAVRRVLHEARAAEADYPAVLDGPDD
jgi:regulatory protein